MSDPVDTGARRAAERLAVELDPRLVMDVEAALHAKRGRRPPERYLDPMSLGGLVVSVASLVWTVYRDLMKHTSAPTPEVVARRVRVEARIPSELTPTQGDRIIEVAVEETIKAATSEA
jgi:hypothetical protein